MHIRNGSNGSVLNYECEIIDLSTPEGRSLATKYMSDTIGTRDVWSSYKWQYSTSAGIGTTLRAYHNIPPNGSSSTASYRMEYITLGNEYVEIMKKYKFIEIKGTLFCSYPALFSGGYNSGANAYTALNVLGSAINLNVNFAESMSGKSTTFVKKLSTKDLTNFEIRLTDSGSTTSSSGGISVSSNASISSIILLVK